MPVAALSSAPVFGSRVPIQFICPDNTALNVTGASVLFNNPSVWNVVTGSVAKVDLGLNGILYYRGDGEFAPFYIDMQWKQMGYNDYKALAALRPYYVHMISFRNIGYYGKLVLDGPDSQKPNTADVIQVKAKFYPLTPSDSTGAVAVARYQVPNYVYDGAGFGASSVAGSWQVKAGAFAEENGTGFGGNNAYKIVGTGSAFASSYVGSPIIQVVPGQTYTYSAYIDATNCASGTNPSVGIYDPTFAVTTYASTSQAYGTNGRVSGQVTIPGGVTQVRMALSASGAVVANGQPLRVSAPQFEDGSVLHAYTDPIGYHVINGGVGTGYILANANNYYWLTFSTNYGESMPIATDAVSVAAAGTRNTIFWNWPTSSAYVIKASIYVSSTSDPTTARLLAEVPNGLTAQWTDYVGYGGTNIGQKPPTLNTAYRGQWQGGIWFNEVP